MKIVLIRHGQTEWNLDRRIQGWHNSPLTSEAEELLRQLPLPELVSPIIYSSDLGRSHQSAQILADRLGLSVITDTRLRERKLGVLEGKVIDQDHELTSFWNAYHRRYEYKMDAVFGAESEQDFESRILSFLHDIVQMNEQYLGDEKEVVVVSHGEWIRAFINILSGVPSWRKGRGIENNGTPFVLEYSGQPYGLSESSDVAENKETA
ncbi:histidine phosphatase family protein [Vibrio hannami]|uniref:histidine phosphatase family protein n=1 Tax=Vibrio hannami TaxID=2717094 RepID=UPI0024106C54|nr:histidine phosphatase family protein [Vibrio hannami]MDG3085188.1 histidine phosphatase family protein [Vibrio hannami]